MKHFFYKTVGALYIVLALPSLVIWLWGSAFPDENYVLTFSIGGLPLGFLLFFFGTGNVTANKFNVAALKTATLGLGGYLPLAIAFSFFRAGSYMLLSLLVLSIFFITFATLIAFVFGVLGILHGKRGLSSGNPIRPARR